MTDQDVQRERIQFSRHLLWAFASGAGAIGLATVLIEGATDRWLAEAIGSPVFVSTPLGLAAVALSVLALKNNPRTGLIPAGLAVAYWVAFFLHL